MGAKILLVDDEITMVKYLSRHLIKKGYSIASCYNGSDAIKEVTKADFDVVLLDVLMAGMDGIDTLREIKKIRPLTEVILLTGYASAEVGVKGIEAGAFNYMIKPFEPHDLEAEIKMALEQRQIKEMDI